MADVAAADFISPNAVVKRPIFDGTELSVILVRSAVGPNAQPGLEFVRLAEIASERGPVLVRATAPFVANFVDPQAPTPWQPEAVVVTVRSPSGQLLRINTIRLRWRPG